MNWLDPQTKELLQKVRDEDLAPPKTAEFALVLLRKSPEESRLVQAIIQINHCSAAEASLVLSQNPPVTINSDLTEKAALWGQFELICSDAISIFLRSEVVEQNERAYLSQLFARFLESPEFKPAVVCLTHVPENNSGDRFTRQFLGCSRAGLALPVTRVVPYKKARIMAHWSERVGAGLIVQKAERG